MTFLLAVVSGSVGAVTRYLIAGFVQQRIRRALPIGTAVVNLIGAFALGVVLGHTDPTSLVSVTVAGFTGGFTTFSTWMVETLYLAGESRRRALLNVALLSVVGIGLAAIGYGLGA